MALAALLGLALIAGLYGLIILAAHLLPDEIDDDDDETV